MDKRVLIWTRSPMGLVVYLVLALAFIAGGAGGAVPGASGSQQEPAQSQYAYVSNSGSQDVTMYQINRNNGQLTSIGTVPANGNNPQAIAVAPPNDPGKFAVTGRPVLVVNQNSNNITTYTINPGTGELNPVGSAPTGNSPQAVAFTPDGDMAVVANGGSNNVSVYNVSPANGSIESVQTVPAGQNPVAVTTNPSGDVVYVANQGSNNISAYKVNPGTGTLSQVGPMVPMPPGSGAPTSIAVLPTGTVAVATSTASNSMGIFLVNPAPTSFTPALIPVASVPVSGGPTSISISPEGIAAVTLMSAGTLPASQNQQSGAVAIYQISPTGMVSFRGIAPTGNSPISVAVDPSGSYAYVANRNANTLSAFAITSGFPMPLGSVQAGASPRSVALVF